VPMSIIAAELHLTGDIYNINGQLIIKHRYEINLAAFKNSTNDNRIQPYTIYLGYHVYFYMTSSNNF
jgi:hypothetical protein